MDHPAPLKRVTRACDYCRKKRLKCTGQRPCLNCQLYGADCSTTDHPKADNAGEGRSGRKRKRASTAKGIRDSTDPGDENEEQQSSTHIEINESFGQQSSPTTQGPSVPIPVPPSQAAQIPSPWIPTTEPEICPPIDISLDFDQFASDAGLILAPFWTSNSRLPDSLDGLDVGDEAGPGMYHSLPTPRPSDDAPSSSLLDGFNPPATAPMGYHQDQSHLEPTDPNPTLRSAHGLFLRKGASDSKFLGMGSIGSTILECLRHPSSAYGGSMESSVLNHLVGGIKHIDELATSEPFLSPPLPAVEFAESGINGYYKFVHMLYPIMENDFFHKWRRVYDRTTSMLSPTGFSSFCLVISIGNLVSPMHSDNDTWQATKLLQEQAWSLIDNVMANPFMESVQVMLLHTIFLLYCGKTGIAWMTCGLAVRMAQSLGLHQPVPPQLGLSLECVNLRSRLWSVAYTLDAFLSLSEGRPPATTAPPNLELSRSISEQEFVLVAAERPAIYVHDWDISLAVIAADVHSLLANSQSLHRVFTKIAEIDSRLLAWRDSISMDFRPDQEILAEDPSYSIVAILHLKYHNLMRTIHWISLTFASEAKSVKLAQYGARVRSSESICVSSARCVIDVLNAASEKGVAARHGGFMVPYCMASISIFYRQILREPSRPGSRTNLEHMRDGTLHIMSMSDRSRSMSQFPALFEEMLRIAEDVVRKATIPPSITGRRQAAAG